MEVFTELQEANQGLHVFSVLLGTHLPMPAVHVQLYLSFGKTLHRLKQHEVKFAGAIPCAFFHIDNCRFRTGYSAPPTLDRLSGIILKVE